MSPALGACGGSTVTPPEETPDTGALDASSDSPFDGSPDVPTDSVADTAPTDGSAVTADQACADAADALCAIYDSCTKVLVPLGFGDLAKCKERLKLGCLPGLAAPGTSSTPAKLAACAKDLKAASCADVLAKKTPASCTPSPGTIKLGGACAEDAQCETTFCASTPGAGGCGACTALPKEGDPCVSRQCGRALDCNKAEKCYRPRVLSEACAADTPCASGLSCFGGKCVAAAKAGEACDATEATAPACDGLQMLGCNPVLKVCQKLAFAKAGEICGLTGGTYALCTAGATCKTTGGTSGLCQAPAADGAACGPAPDGPGCMSPAVCSGGSCKIKDPATCK